MDAARSLDRWTRLLLQVSADSAVIDGTGIFNLLHSSMKQAEVFDMLLDNKNCQTIKKLRQYSQIGIMWYYIMFNMNTWFVWNYYRILVGLRF